MFMVLVLGLVLRAAMIRMPSALDFRQNSQMADLCMEAARSGLDYAVYRLRDNPAWEGGEEQELVLDKNGMKVTEVDGLVVGEMKTEGGPTLFFRFRFKPTGEEGELISLNNLGSDVPVKLPHSTEENPEGFEVPAHAVCLFVEGGIGELDDSGLPRTDGRVVEAVYRLVPDGGVKDAVLMSAGDMVLNVARDEGQVYLSGTYLDRANGDALRLRSKKSIQVVNGSGGTARLVLAPKSEAELGNSGGVRAEYDSSDVTLVEEYKDDGQDFYNLTWDQIPKADGRRASRDSIQIPGGVYVYGRPVEGGSSGGGRFVAPEQVSGDREIRYYDMSLNAYLRNAKELAENPDAGVVVDPRLTKIRTRANVQRNSEGFNFAPGVVSYYPPKEKRPIKYDGFRFNLRKVNLYVVKSEKGREDLAIIPRAPGKFDMGDRTDYPNLDDPFNPDHLSMNLVDSSLTVPGDVYIQGGVNGKGGTIVSEGDISILAGRTLQLASEGRSEIEMEKELEAQLGLVEKLASGVATSTETTTQEDASLQLNLYSKGDLNLSTYVERADAYRSLTFRGLLYSWGDIHVWAGKGNKARRGTLTLQGAMVAYGNNPINGAPGGSRGGEIDVRARNINLAWDPRYLPSLSELQPDNKSTFALRQARIREVR